MAVTRFIGDIHGHFDAYQTVIQGAESSIQVGDFGYGFRPDWDSAVRSWQNQNPQHRFIRGNHDCLSVCQTSPTWIQDMKVEGNRMFLGGAWSIDHAWRTPGINWWKDEELSYAELVQAQEIYLESKPELMISHDCPLLVSNEMFIKRGDTFSNRQISTRTGSALDQMFQAHQPKIWIFGHWHVSRIMDIQGTTFICLGELDSIDLDLDTLIIAS